MTNRLIGLLDRIRLSPSDYLAEYTVSRISLFTTGYCYCLTDHDDGSAEHKCLGELLECATKRFKPKYSWGWDKILLNEGNTEQGALTLFWKLWDELVTGGKCGSQSGSTPPSTQITPHEPAAQPRLDKFIREVRRNPAMYVGTYSITPFYVVLRGYLCALTDLDGAQVENDRFKQIEQTIVDLYPASDEHDFDIVLRSASDSDASALDLFWAIWDKHLLTAS